MSAFVATTARVRALVRRLRHSSTGRAGAATMAASVGMLCINLLTGATLARSLGTSGRGVVTAIQTAVPFVAWLMGMGGGQAVTYHQARRPEDAPALITTYAMLIPPLALLAIGAGELAVHFTFAHQTPAARTLAQIFMLTSGFTVLSDVSLGMLLGGGDFRFYNAQRMLQPLATLVLYIVLHELHLFTVAAALSVTTSVGVLTTLACVFRVIHRHGLAKPSLSLARKNLWYGFRAHGTNVSNLANLRLDVFMLPAFVAASQIGLYAVATSVSGIVYTVSGALSLIVVPAAAKRSNKGQAEVVLLTMRTSLMVGAAIAGVLALFGPLAIHIVYGSAFAAARTTMWVLLPGTVMYGACTVPIQGLYAANRPMSATMAQGVGFAVTATGLLVLLPHGGGIMAAAAVSTVAYTSSFTAATLMYCRAVGARYRDVTSAKAGSVTGSAEAA